MHVYISELLNFRKISLKATGENFLFSFVTFSKFGIVLFEWDLGMFMYKPSIPINSNSSNFSCFCSLFFFTTHKESQSVLNSPRTSTVVNQAPESMQSEDSRQHPASESRNDDNSLGCVSTH